MATIGDGNAYDEATDNVYDALPGASHLLNDKDEDKAMFFDEPAGAASLFSSDPPPLLPKKGNSFRQSSLILDRHQSNISPKPVPRIRKQSLDPLSDIEAAGTPLSSASRISRSCEFSPPILVGTENPLSAAATTVTRGLSSSTLVSSMSFNEGVVNSSDDVMKKPVAKMSSLGSPAVRPVPVPRSRTVFKKKESESDIKVDLKDEKPKDMTTESSQMSSSEKEHNFDLQSFQNEFDKFTQDQNKEIDDLFDFPKQDTSADDVFKDLDKNTNKSELGSLSLSNISNDEEGNVYEDLDENAAASSNLPSSASKAPSLPPTPKVPPRPAKAKTSFHSPDNDEEQNVDDLSWNKSITDNEASKNSETDFFNFDAFNISSSSAASNDPWPGIDNVSSSDAVGKQVVNDAELDLDFSQTFGDQSKNKMVLNENFSHTSGIASFDSAFGTNSASAPHSSSVHPNPVALIDLGDFDPLSTSNKTDNNSNDESVPSNTYSVVNKANSEPSSKLLVDTLTVTAPSSDTTSSPPCDSMSTSQGTYVDLDAISTSVGDVYSFAKPSAPQPPPKPSKPTITHAPSFHYSPPTAPPPPLPRTESQLVRESAPPPIPPRPTAVGVLPARPVAPPRASKVLEDLPTPVFSPMGANDASDPFKDSDFGDECYNFNKTLTLNQQQAVSSSQASEFASTPSPVAAASASDTGYDVSFPAREPLEAGAAAYPDPKQDPDRISQFVIPAPSSSGSSTPGNNLPTTATTLDASGDSIYNLAEVIRPRKEPSSDESEFGDGLTVSAVRPRWTSGGQPVAGLTVMDSGQLAPKKNQRYGYLYKQGGYNANKGWKKRWVVFNGTSLSYYDSNTSQVSKRIIPVACMKEVLSDVKTNERHNYKFKVVTTLQDRVFIFSAESLEDCVLWSNFIMAGITEYKKAKMEAKNQAVEEKSDKEGFIKFSNMKKYYVVISGHHLRYFRSFKDFQMGSPIHEIDMKLASVKVKDRRKCRLQLWLNYDHFDLSFENDSDMQSWRMAMEDAIAEGLADDTVLEKVYHNISNRECADCGAEKPHWASINLGIVVCKNCAGIHRMFDYHVSKIRSLRMDTRVWTPSLIELMVTIGNANANAFWEYSLPHHSKLHPSCTVMQRKDFIQKKYFNKKFRNHHPLTGSAQALGEELHNAASTDNVLEAMKILFSGADVLFRKDGCEETAYDIAKEAGQRLIMELLYQNCGDPQAVVEDEEDESRIREDIRLQGYLNKTGPVGRTYDKRWCIIEHGALNYYINDKSLTSKGSIDRKNMLLVKETTLDRVGFHFEISTNTRESRVYSFSTDSRDEAGEWMRTVAKLMAPVAVMEHVGMIDIKFAGYAHIRESIGTEWKQSFLVFTWRGLYYMNKDLKLDYIDLRKASSIKLQNADSGYHLALEKGPCFIICSTGKSLYLQAPLARDTEKMFNALLYAIKGSGRTLIDQALTNDNVPVIVDKCITHISKLGIDEKGMYRLGAQTSRVRTLLDEFKEDAGAVVLEGYTVHEVANALKRFLRELEDSVFERINYPQWISMAASKDVNNRLMWYKYYLEKMPSVNYNTLKRLVLHLSQVAQYETSNQMNMTNLATCFAPSLLRTEMDMPDLMSDVSSREISIIVDLMAYQYYFFEDKENERTINDNIRRAQQQIMQMMQETRDSSSASSANIERILTPVHMINAEGPAVNIPVTEDTKAQQALDYFKRSKATSDIDTSSFALYELVAKGILVRPLFPDELLSPTVKRWLGWEDWVKEDNAVSLCARNTELLEKLDANYNPSHILLSKLQYCDSKSKRFKRFFVGFKQCRLAVYVNSKAVIEVASWNVEDLSFFIGSMPKKSTPTKYCLTFIVNGEKSPKVVGAFGHCLCFDTEDELYRWAAALYMAQHPGGFLTWNI